MTDVSKIISFNATEATVRALDELVLATGDHWTDCLNKAVQAYSVIQAADEVYIRDTPESEPALVRFR